MQPLPHTHTGTYHYHYREPAKGHLKHWWISEIAGDFGAVPLTVAVQRLFPGFMQVIRRIMEPVLAPLFHNGAKRATRIWAKQHHVEPGSERFKEQEHHIYEREISHLPQALVWTFSSTAINIVAQKMSGNTGPIPHLIADKLAGAALSASMVVGFRELTPEQAYRWDTFTSKHLFEPVTRHSWQARLQSEKKSVQQLQ